MQPTLEDRVESLEVRVSKTEASTLKISRDIKQLGLDIGDAIDRNTAAIMQEVRKIEAKLEARGATMATMATKDDISALKGDIITIETRLGRIESTQQKQELLLQAILERLPPKR
jgi:hypothetical protein